MTEQSEDRVHISFYVEARKRRAVKLLAAQQDLSVSQFMRRLVDQELVKEEAK